MITNPSFVAREYIQDDEVVNSRDGLFDHFGGDNYCITRDVGLAHGNDGYEPCPNEERPCDMSHYIILADYQDLTHEENGRVKEAVTEVLALQKFFRTQKEAEEREAERQLLAYWTERDDADMLDAKEAMRESRELYEGYDDPVEPEVVEIWQMRKINTSYADGLSTLRPGKNSRHTKIGNRGGKSFHDTRNDMILAEVVVNGKPFRTSRAA